MTGGSEIAFASAEALADLYRKTALSPVEAAEILFARLDALQPKLNFFGTPTATEARPDRCSASNRRRSRAPLPISNSRFE